MSTFQDFLPFILKAALFVPAVAIALYLAYQEVWVSVRDLFDKFPRYSEIPRKTRKDHIQFWVWGRLPEAPPRRWQADQDAA